jgi:hypothetical protein
MAGGMTVVTISGMHESALGTGEDIQLPRCLPQQVVAGARLIADEIGDGDAVLSQGLSQPVKG